MKILVCGGAGFLGSHVADALSDAGHDVAVFDARRSPHLRKGQSMLIGNILDEKLVNDAVKGCGAVYNFAAIADMDDAKRNPIETVKNNILGNTIILDACARNGVGRFVFASTVYVYSNRGSFYRSSKQACELLIENYRQIYGLEYTILRYGSLYGPRAEKTNWFNSILNQALTEKRIVRYGDGEELRDYIHVFDAARCSVEVLKPDYKNQHIIIAGNQQVKIKDLLVMVKEMMGNNIEIVYKAVDDKECWYDPDLHYEITPYSFNPKLAKRIINNHYIDLGQGILDILNSIHREETVKNIL